MYNPARSATSLKYNLPGVDRKASSVPDFGGGDLTKVSGGGGGRVKSALSSASGRFFFGRPSTTSSSSSPSSYFQLGFLFRFFPSTLVSKSVPFSAALNFSRAALNVSADRKTQNVFHTVIAAKTIIDVQRVA